jgi:uncharacterized protein YaiE (UPF0345 family)
MVRRVILVAVPVLAVVIAIGFMVSDFMLQQPGPLGSGTTTNIHLETVGAVGSALEWPRPNDPHPDWVGYLPTTTFNVPANSTVTFQIDQEDSATGLRNPFWGQVFGTVGNNMHIKGYDDKGNPIDSDMTSINPDDAAHTFAIPDLGVFVPLFGVSANAPANTYNTVTFQIQTHGPGRYRWQCFVPCGAQSIFGNGGPMQTLGYMGGWLVVH